jgi:xylulokinase
MFHPYLNGELTPYADPLLRGSFTGVRFGHGKAHFSRAVLEGVALSLLDCKRALAEIGIPHARSAAVIGGGAGSPLWRQIVADALGLSLHLKENSDSSFGSAMLAGVAAGAFDNLAAALARCAKTVSVTQPQRENAELYADLYLRYRRIHDALAPLYHEMG